ncbi:uncharacterized protein DS421_14g460260 [Arachis hypogaea]|nr:uncharacterized protein DS421_14g460260 [Arachis hypogaea]
MLLAIGGPPHTSQGTAVTFPLFLLFEAPPSCCPCPPKVAASLPWCSAFTSSSQLSLGMVSCQYAQRKALFMANGDKSLKSTRTHFSGTKNTSNKNRSGLKRATPVESFGKATSLCARWETLPRKRWSTATASEWDDAYAVNSRLPLWLVARSVVTTVSSLQSDIRHLTDAFDRQNEMLADLRRTIVSLICQNNQDFNSNGITNVSSGCVCSGMKRLKEQHLDIYKGKKHVIATPICSMDGADDPTYIPPTKTEFSMDHMPFRSTKAKKNIKQLRRGPKTQDRTKKNPNW